MTNAAATKENVLIRILAPAMGAEVIGMDLSKPMNEAEVASLRNELNKYRVLCFRDQVLSEAQQIDFSKRWGPLEDFPEENKTVIASTVYNVANVSAEGVHLPETDHRVISQKVNAFWHTDSSYRYVPAYASLLYGISVLSCMSSAMSETGGEGLGTLGLSASRAESMARQAGFTQFKKLDVEHSVNAFYEVRP